MTNKIMQLEDFLTLVLQNRNALVEIWDEITPYVPADVVERLREKFLRIDDNHDFFEAHNSAVIAAMEHAIYRGQKAVALNEQDMMQMVCTYVQRTMGRNQSWAEDFTLWVFGRYDGIVNQFDENDFIAEADALVEQIQNKTNNRAGVA